jgi:hypothetical protein
VWFDGSASRSSTLLKTNVPFPPEFDPPKVAGTTAPLGRLKSPGRRSSCSVRWMSSCTVALK